MDDACTSDVDIVDVVQLFLIGRAMQLHAVLFAFVNALSVKSDVPLVVFFFRSDGFTEDAGMQQN